MPGGTNVTRTSVPPGIFPPGHLSYPGIFPPGHMAPGQLCTRANGTGLMSEHRVRQFLELGGHKVSKVSPGASNTECRLQFYKNSLVQIQS